MVINNRPVIGTSKPVDSQRNIQKPDAGHVENSFGTVLKEKLQAQDRIRFSKHAEHRLHMRNINLNTSQIERIGTGINKAEEKGVKDSLILMDNLALVVNIRNRTVVTAANTDELKENVFTNIDGAVIV